MCLAQLVLSDYGNIPIANVAYSVPELGKSIDIADNREADRSDPQGAVSINIPFGNMCLLIIFYARRQRCFIYFPTGRTMLHNMMEQPL